ncbi:MAG: hypothetical protein ACTSYR_06055, partial [Candidatus Odinarchaeia archaeon]
ITKLLKQKTKRAEVDNVPLDFYLYLESMISKGSADIIRFIFIDGKIAVVGDKDKVKSFVRFLKRIIGKMRNLKIIEYSEQFVNSDIIGLPYELINSIPEDFLIVDLINRRVISKRKCEYCNLMYARIKNLPFEEQMKFIRDTMEKLRKNSVKLLTLLKNRQIDEIKQFLSELDEGFKTLLLDYIISNNSLLKFLRECKKYIAVDVLLSFDKHLIYLEGEIFYSGVLKLEEEINLIRKIYEKLNDYLGPGKMEIIAKLIRTIIK